MWSRESGQISSTVQLEKMSTIVLWWEENILANEQIDTRVNTLQGNITLGTSLTYWTTLINSHGRISQFLIHMHG